MGVMILLTLGLLGLILGSFVNALVWRLYEKSLLEGKTSKAAIRRRQDLSITTGHSMCPQCQHTLAAKDLVPLVSWLSLRGKCRYCHAAISRQYPLVEVVTAALFILSYVVWPLSYAGVGLFQFVVWLLFIVVFVAMAVYDLRWFILPDVLVIPTTVLAALQVAVVALWTHSLTALWEPVLGALLIFGLFWMLFQISKGKWIGGGDVKLVIALGLLAGTPLRAFLVLFLSSVLGTLVSIPLLTKGKQGLKMHIPYGPYLLGATIIVVLYGTDIVNWYRRLLVV